MTDVGPSSEDNAPSSSKVPQPECSCRKTLELDALSAKSLVTLLPVDENSRQKLGANSDEKTVAPSPPPPPHAIQSGNLLQAHPTICHSLPSRSVSLGDVLHTNEASITCEFPRKVSSEPALGLSKNLPNRSRNSLSITPQYPLRRVSRASNSEISLRTHSGHYQTYILGPTAASASHANPASTSLAPLSGTQDESTLPIAIKLRQVRPLFQSTRTTSPLILSVSTPSSSSSQASAIHQPRIEPSDQAFSVPTETTISFGCGLSSPSSSHSAISISSNRPQPPSQTQFDLRSQKPNSDQRKNGYSAVRVHPITGPGEPKAEQNSPQGRTWSKCRGESARSLGSFCPVVISSLCAVGIPAGCIICNTSWLVSSEKSPGGKVVLALYYYLIGIMLSSMWTVVSGDAGSIPRNLDPDPGWEEEGTSDPTQGNQDWMETASNSQVRIRPRWVSTGDYLVPTKWCSRCRTYRPPRAIHCRICDVCVEQSDHHCTFLNNCIGRKNYFTFLVFLLTTSISMLCTITLSIVHLVFISDRRYSPEAIGNYVVIAFGLILGSPVLGLLIFHLRLISRNVTTMERLRPIAVQDEEGGSTKEDVPIYSLGSWHANGLWIICRPSFGLGRSEPSEKIIEDWPKQSSPRD